jgi:23S rRNA pseudouridine2605 synthase
VTEIAESPTPKANGIRLQTYLASCGVASRRACEAIILDGRVSVDGATVTELGVRVREGSRVELDGRPVKPERRKRYLVLNKPAGVLSSLSDPHGRRWPWIC